MKLSLLRILTGVVTLLVVAAVVVGLFMAGSPGAQRDRQFDAQRIGHLEQVTYAVDSYFEIHHTLPSTLVTLSEENPSYGVESSMFDPLTELPYEYRVTGASTYELCATFALANELEEGDKKSMTRPVSRYPYESYSPKWSHSAGRHCFSLEANIPLPGVTCGLLSPCPAEQTCAVLPGQTQAFCVPQGKECLAAGCANNQCVIAESYPVQVRCATLPAP